MEFGMEKEEMDFRIAMLQEEIRGELADLEKKMLKPMKDEQKYLAALESRLRQAKWANKKFDLHAAPHPRMVKQREIFYCELGQNIGSEQDGRRPVVILQNNVGNAHAKITLIAPITSFQQGSIKNIDGQLYLEDRRGSQIIMTPLRFYDIPLELEPTSKYNIYGVVNISQIRVISKSRLALTPVATITESNYEKIVEAIDTNLSIFERRG